MSGSNRSCSICGEVEDVTRIDWGCVVCNPDKNAAARKPEVPIVPGPVPDETAEQRRALAEARLLTEIDAANEDGGGRRAPMLGVMLLYAILLLLVASCTMLVWANWPTNAPHHL